MNEPREYIHRFAANKQARSRFTYGSPFITILDFGEFFSLPLSLSFSVCSAF